MPNKNYNVLINSLMGYISSMDDWYWNNQAPPYENLLNMADAADLALSDLKDIIEWINDELEYAKEI